MSGIQSRKAIVDETNAIRTLLLDKNERYGNQAAEPIGIFSGLSPEEGIRIRIDDKLRRLQNQQAAGDDSEDTELDLIGYLVLLRVLRRLEEA